MANPTRAAMTPPMSIQIALLVGDPVKNLETSELNEFVALKPTTMRIMPPTSRARERSLLIMAFRSHGIIFCGPITLIGGPETS
jgi:hypothetical protein